MIDQATRLRGLMESRTANQPPRISGDAMPTVPVAETARVIAVTSGKGGVGKSSIALNLAIAFSRFGDRVCLIDGNPGLSNIDVLCGINGYWNLSHVASGTRGIKDVVMAGPEGISIVSGAGCLAERRDEDRDARLDVIRQTSQLEEEHDYLVIDNGCGTSPAVKRFVGAADVALVVTTPEPTSIADAYATIKGVSVSPPRNLMVLVNQSESTGQATAIIDRMRRTANLFLHTEIENAGHVPHDRQLIQSVSRRVPLMIDSPRSPSAEAIEQLARRVKSATAGSSPRGRFFHRIMEQAPVFVP